MITPARLDEWTREHIRSSRALRTRALVYNVAPRYTPGSPAIVTEDMALRIAKEEENMYNEARSGLYGGEMREKALKLGASGIVELRYETPKGWDVLDVITGETLLRPYAKERRRR